MKLAINKNFATRDDLDKYVRSTFGENAESNSDVSIEMSADEMATFSLDESTTVYGVKVVTADQSDVVVEVKPSRVVLGSKRKATKKRK